MFRPTPQTTSTTPSDPQSTYIPLKPTQLTASLSPTLIRHLPTGTLHLSKPYSKSYIPELASLRSPTSKPDSRIIAFEAAARILNHENLISIAGVLPPPKPAAEPKSLRSNEVSLIFDFCSDGNLKALFDRPPCEIIKGEGFLPEGLVWHVATSMLRALMFLHEGWREEAILLNKPSEDGEKYVLRKYKPDDDWLPILHRSIRAENIHFQARRGKETYGLCKLGDFGRCVVSGTARIPREEESDTGDAGFPEVVAVLNNLAGREVRDQEEMRKIWGLEKGVDEGDGNWESTKKFGRVYTIGSELADLGGILYRMMTGERIEIDLCRCGCFHVDSQKACVCGCPYRDIHTDQVLLESKYSAGLREVVVGLIRLNRYHSKRAYVWYDKAWKAYKTWKGSPDGRGHFDHYDDLVARKRAEQRREMETIRLQLGEEEFKMWKAARADETLMAWE